MIEHYIIVLGGTKCGTSSLFRYLGDHPEISPSFQKQTDFFLKSYESNDSAKLFQEYIDTQFKKNFTRPPNTGSVYYLDVSPDYFCSQIALRNLKLFAESKSFTLIIVLRDPVERLISWYRFGQLIDLVPQKMSFGEFVENQDPASENAAFRAMETGRFVSFLNEWKKHFHDKRLQCLFFDRLSSDPESLMTSIANTIGIDSDFYKTYTYNTYNKTQAAKSQWLQSVYVKLQVAIKKMVLRSDLVNRFAEPVFRVGASTYRKLNTRAPSHVVIDEQLRNELSVYYIEEIDYLNRAKINLSCKN